MEIEAFFYGALVPYNCVSIEFYLAIDKLSWVLSFYLAFKACSVQWLRAQDLDILYLWAYKFYLYVKQPEFLTFYY